MSDIMPQTVLNKARKDKFILILDTPPVLKEYETNSARTNALLNRDKMQFSIIGINVPDHKIPAISVPYRGQTQHVTSQNRDEYEIATVKFTIDNNFDNYYFIWKWLAVLNDPADSGMDKYFAQFNKQTSNLSRMDILNKTNNNNSSKYKEIKMINNYMAYQTNISMYPLREYNEKIALFKYINALPVKLGGFVYDYRDPQEIECSFDFAYSQMSVELIDPV